MEITPFRNLLNDMYAKDISNKIKSALLTRQKQGKFIGTKAPYEYCLLCAAIKQQIMTKSDKPINLNDDRLIAFIMFVNAKNNLVVL